MKNGKYFNSKYLLKAAFFLFFLNAKPKMFYMFHFVFLPCFRSLIMVGEEKSIEFRELCEGCTLPASGYTRLKTKMPLFVTGFYVSALTHGLLVTNQ